MRHGCSCMVHLRICGKYNRYNLKILINREYTCMCQNIKKSYCEWQISWGETKFCPFFDFCLYMWLWFRSYRPGCCGEQSYQVILKSFHGWQSWWVETKFCSTFWHLTSKCDLDFKATDMAILHDMSSCYAVNMHIKLFWNPTMDDRQKWMWNRLMDGWEDAQTGITLHVYAHPQKHWMLG